MKYHTIENHLPADVCQKLRTDCGLSQVTAGPGHGLYSVLIEIHGTPAAMGRVVGDGKTDCRIIDVCVAPAFRHLGLHRTIMTHIMKFIHTLPAGCLVSFTADGESKSLYREFGFKDSDTPDMFYTVR